MNELKCDICGCSMVFMQRGYSQGWFCLNCGRSIVTSACELLEEKNKKYSIFLLNGDYTNIDHIKVVAKAKNINYIKARSILKSKNRIFLIFGKKEDLKHIIDELNNLNIEYCVESNN
ncbi:hypothetical protein [Ruminococcus sp.]|uniref:hypothetical protein n=1 Tax=Ruminococcus sp. TaxID=41978 RepID=UPI0025D4EEB8|nr:hypothetical protein [Ruminococcus sp.]